MVYLDSLKEISLYHLEGMKNGETASARLENSEQVSFYVFVALLFACLHTFLLLRSQILIVHCICHFNVDG